MSYPPAGYPENEEQKPEGTDASQAPQNQDFSEEQGLTREYAPSDEVAPAPEPEAAPAPEPEAAPAPETAAEAAVTGEAAAYAASNGAQPTEVFAAQSAPQPYAAPSYQAEAPSGTYSSTSPATSGNAEGYQPAYAAAAPSPYQPGATYGSGGNGGSGPYQSGANENEGKSKKGLVWGLSIGAAVLVVLGLVLAYFLWPSGDSEPKKDKASTSQEKKAKDQKQDKAKVLPKVPQIGKDDDSQKTAEGKSGDANQGKPQGSVDAAKLEKATESAKQYLESIPFSRSGLIHQLTYNGEFTEAEATQAVDSLNVDWNEQALRKAQEYVDSGMGLSKKGIAKMLSEKDIAGFTEEQTEYAIANVKADWKAQALKYAQGVVDSGSGVSEKRLSDSLYHERNDRSFTQEEAKYAMEHLKVDWNEQAAKAARFNKDKMNMNDEENRRYLESEHGAGFTKEQVDYGMSQLK
ncbi:hypothetical protein BSR28_00235 [Boudabousia liubingyangii]|uniref:Ltp family lipoprotein n=1 Tax=Boudabousia liubingyangii TaxID=1921764 RepID=UPI00093E537E|nr:Ltp family lipoprotein [Boudabousia liubingyangii]OKL48180.1 hypothetical protein BSR28_00235 [Boudabousia liubingyangii]